MCRLTRLQKKLLAIIFGASLGALSTAYAQHPPGETTQLVNPGNDACTNSAAETRLKQREVALLGPAHAEAHAAARVHKCRVAMGLESVATPSAEVLAAASTLSTTTAGQWSNPFIIPVAGITSVLLNTGKVLFWSYNPPDYLNPNASNTGVAYVWDPATRTGHAITPPENIWCGGQTILSDGRVYVAGGNLRYPDPSAAPGQTGWEGALSNYTFDPATETWTKQPDMTVGRWYPTVTQLADNRVVITSGYDQTGSTAPDGSQAPTQVVEVFTPAAGIDGVGTINTVSMHDPTGLYPFQYLMPSGKMLQAGPDLSNTFLFTPNTWSWSTVPNMSSSHYEYANGIIYTDVSVFPIKQVVMIAGGENGVAAIKNNEWLDGTNPSLGWNRYPQWQQARHNANTVILPDGTLFTVGGNQGVQTNTSYGSPLFEAERYNKPANDPTGQWVRMSHNTIQAAYHSSAILLPDATVLLSQDDMDYPSGATHYVQVYSPPYLFKGTRPQITSGPPSTLRHGQRFAVIANVNNIVSVVLVAPGAVTHGNDMHQRFIKLSSRTVGTNLNITIPSSGAVVPPGYYMFFIVDSNGIPSVAKFVRVS